jgi:hypothetical protein
MAEDNRPPVETPNSQPLTERHVAFLSGSRSFNQIGRSISVVDG